MTPNHNHNWDNDTMITWDTKEQMSCIYEARKRENIMRIWFDY